MAGNRFLVLLLIAPLYIEGGPVVWVAPSLQRIGPEDAAGSARRAELWAARGEYESFQIIVSAPAGNNLTNVDLAVSDLIGSGAQVISKSNFALFREHYVYVSSSSPDWGGPNRPLGPGWYADGLIPFIDPATGAPPAGGTLRAVPFFVPAGQNQPVWVDIFVPRDAMAGQYSGTFTVTSDQGTVTGEVLLHVWSFALSVKPSLRTAFAFSGTPSLADASTLLRNKVSPLNVKPEDVPGLVEHFGLGSANLGFWSGADLSRCAMFPAPTLSEVRARLSKYPADLELFNYSADEVGLCNALYGPIRRWAAILHTAGVKNLVTMTPVPELLDDGNVNGRSAVDIWVVMPKTYDESAGAIEQALAKGDEVWSYNTLVQDAYSPKWEIDFAPINFRIQPGFISQSLHLTGLLYWRVDSWSSDPWNEVNNAGKFSSANYPGEGMLVYPGKTVGTVGVAPSIRLKWIRDGVEDYEYVEMLKASGYGDFALKIVLPVGSDWTHWTRDPDALEAARRQLGSRLDSLKLEQK